MKILVVEDNQKIAKYVCAALREEQYVVDVAYDGMIAEGLISTGSYDLVILDIMLPGKDGISICKSARLAQLNMPILMLTAKGEVGDRVLGLDSGADDFLVKPFALEELIARVRSLLRRPNTITKEVLQVQDIILNTAKHEVSVGDRVLSLTTKEYVVLDYLMRNAGEIVTREQMLDHCWDFAYSAFSNITDVYVKQLRQKLGNTNEKYIKTIRGVGYLLETK